jgi:ATP-dependent RNA helicase RhlE
MRFEDLNLAPDVVRASAIAGWDRPTPLQERAIPALLAGRDAAICQSSGAGKTAAYLLPVLHRLFTDPRPGLRVLLLVPEGDHAEKVLSHTGGLCARLSIACASVGREGDDPAGASLAIVAPPQFESARPLLAGLDLLVLDGVEGWIEQGGGDALKAAAELLPPTCQRVLLSDESGPEVEAFHTVLLRTPDVFPSLQGSQVAYPVPPSVKIPLLLRLLADGEIPPSLVLARSRHRADRLFRALGRKGVKALRIQGRVGRGQRERWSQALEASHKTFLIAAELDLASYGALAVANVFYFDTPGSPQGYSGRFQGAFFGPEGRTVIFVGEEEEPRLQALEAAFGAAIPRKTVEGFDYTATEPSSPEAERDEEDPPPGNAPKERQEGRDPSRQRSKRNRKKEQGRKGQGQPQPPQAPPKKKLPEGLPKDEELDEDSEDEAQPNFNTDRPLFPGQRPFRWNSFRLSLERVESGAGQARSQEPQETSGEGGSAKGRRRRKRKGRTGPPDRSDNRGNRRQGERPASPTGDDNQPDSNEGERRVSSQEVVARRFNRSARYSSLAGAPIPPKEVKD